MTLAHEQRVWQIAKHPQLDLLASVSADLTCKIFRSDKSVVKVLDEVHERSVRSASWRPHTETLALGSFDSTISVFSYESPEWEFIAQLEGPENEVKKVSWSSDGRYLASCSRDKSVWVWEIDADGEDFECSAVLQEHEQDVKHVAWHNTTNLLASASYDDTVKLWRQDDEEWVCTATLQGHKSTVWSCSFHPTEMRIATCSADLKCRIYKQVSMTGGQNTSSLPSTANWDVLSEVWELECELPAVHSHCIYSIEWAANGIISAGADGKICLYQEENGKFEVSKIIENAHGVYEVNCATWCNDQIVSGGDDGQIKFWDIK